MRTYAGLQYIIVHAIIFTLISFGGVQIEKNHYISNVCFNYPWHCTYRLRKLK